MVVDAPEAWDTVASPVRIQGRARVFEADVRIRITDATGAIVADAFTTAAEGAPTLAPFDASVTFVVAHTEPRCVEVFEESARDGRPVNMVQVPVVLAP